MPQILTAVELLVYGAGYLNRDHPLLRVYLREVGELRYRRVSRAADQ